MMQTLLFALLAAYILFRLWSVLGKRTGFEAPPPPVEPQKNPAGNRDNIIALPSALAKGKLAQPPTRQQEEKQTLSPSLQKELEKIQAVDPDFGLDAFLTGAAAAFEIIVNAFAQGDKDTLKPLLSPPVFKSFLSVIQDRQEAQQTVDTRIVELDQPEVISIETRRTQEHITLKFLSEQVVVTTNAEGKILDNPARLGMKMTDIWTFSRPVGSEDPNWVLAATRVEGN